MPQLNLIVIRSKDIERSRDFYERLGLKFAKEQHRSGPEHYAAVLEDGCVFEIYPLGTRKPTSDVRLGFIVESVLRTKRYFADIRHCLNNTDDGKGVVVLDPDEHTVEFREK